MENKTNLINQILRLATFAAAGWAYAQKDLITVVLMGFLAVIIQIELIKGGK